MIIINLYGGPGSGKSTNAAKILYQLKSEGYKVELVTEFAKDLTYDESKSIGNQLYVFGEQYNRIAKLEGKVDIVVTDSPILLSDIYCSDERIRQLLKPLLFEIYDRYHNINVFIERTKKYENYGRTQTEEESDLISKKIHNLLTNNNIEFITETSNVNVERIKCFLK